MLARYFSNHVILLANCSDSNKINGIFSNEILKATGSIIWK